MPENDGPVARSSDALDYGRRLAGEAWNAPDHYLDVLTLACAATYKVRDLYSAPRIIVLGGKGTGKSTALTVAGYLAGGTTSVTGIKAITAPSYIASYRANSSWTPLLDEVNHLFGEAGQAGKGSQLYTYLNQGYRRDTGWAGHVENKVTVRIPIFGIAFLAGQGKACPDDLADRGVVMPLPADAPYKETLDFSDEGVRNKFKYAGRMLESWATALPALDTSEVRKLHLHPQLVKRNMDVWGPLFAVAMHAGDTWIKRCLMAFEAIECNRKEVVHTPELQLLLDYATFAEQVSARAQQQQPQQEPEQDETDAFAAFGESELGSDGSSDIEGIASGEFAQFAMSQPHAAFAWMKPREFALFAVAQLGPTTPFWDAAQGKMVRGWSDIVHRMNTDRASQELARLAAEAKGEVEGPVTWEDF